jgi:hypothetical protein
VSGIVASNDDASLYNRPRPISKGLVSVIDLLLMGVVGAETTLVLLCGGRRGAAPGGSSSGRLSALRCFRRLRRIDRDRGESSSTRPYPTEVARATGMRTKLVDCGVFDWLVVVVFDWFGPMMPRPLLPRQQ